MPPTDAKYRIRGPWPNCPTPVFYVDSEADGSVRVATDDSIRLARQFTKAEVLIRVKHLREKKLWNCCAVSGDGTVVFESETAAVKMDDGTDTRSAVFYIPDGHESDQLGYIVRPARRPDLGKCWCLKAADIPSLAASGREIESVYDLDIEQCVLKFLLICKQAGIDLATLPSRRPDLDRIEDIELRKIIQNIQNQNSRAPANVRPGDR